MKIWKQEDAVSELEYLTKQIDILKSTRRMSSQHTEWGIRVLEFLEDIFGLNSRVYLSFANISWHETGTMILHGGWNLQEEIDTRHQAAYIQQLDSAKGILLAAYSQMKRFPINELYEGKNTSKEASDIIKVIALAERSLRKAIHEKPSEERQVQEVFENLLIGADLAYSREGENIEYSSKKYVPDFILKKIQAVIEIKICNRETREKEIIAEINDDILAYGTRYPNMLFVIYDLGYIRDADRFSAQFEKNPGVIVRIVKH